MREPTPEWLSASEFTGDVSEAIEDLRDREVSHLQTPFELFTALRSVLIDRLTDYEYALLEGVRTTVAALDGIHGPAVTDYAPS